MKTTCGLLLILATSSFGYPYNDFPYSRSWPEAPRYPKNCCQLEWEDIQKNDSLPRDYIHAGTFMDRNWAFARNSYPTACAKSDQPGEVANCFGNGDGGGFPYSILTNPNKCLIGWYTSTCVRREKPNHHWFFPSVGKSKYGDYVRYNRISGSTSMQQRSVQYLSRPEGYQTAELKREYDLLYVDCRAPALSISTTNPSNVTVRDVGEKCEDEMNKLKEEVQSLKDRLRDCERQLRYICEM